MKKKILIVNDEMVVGGVARVLNNMLRNFDYSLVDVDLLLLHKHGEMLRDVPKEVNVLEGTGFYNVCDMPFSELVKNKQFIGIIKKLYLFFLMKTGLIFSKNKKERKKILKKEYDVEIAYKEGFCTIFVASGDTKKKVNWVHVDYKVHNYSNNHMPLMKKALAKIDVHVAQSVDAANSYKEVFELDKEFLIINNMIDEKMIKTMAYIPYSYPTNDFNIVSVGRLHFQKAYLRMLDAHKILINQGYKYHFYVVGEGEEREEIEKKINEYNVNDSFILIGYDQNPYKYIKNADLFLLPSIYESAPTVVYEALTINETPIMSTLVAGVNSQLNDGKFGLVVENSVDGIVYGIKKLLDNKEELANYLKAMKDYTSTNKKSLEKIYRLFDINVENPNN